MGKLRIENWVGLATAVSPYVLPPGTTVRQNNLEITRPGELRQRSGMDAVYAAGDYSEVTGMYRASNGANTLDDLIVCCRTSSTQTTVRYQTPADTNSPSGWDFTVSSTITTDSTASPAFSEDRHGRIYAFHGNAIPPKVISRSTKLATDIGLTAPTIAPNVVPSGNGYFIERVDVIEGGGSYWAPPPIVISGGGLPSRPARLKTIIQGGAVVSVDVIDGGSGYATAPTLTIDESSVKGVGFVGYGVIGIDPGIQAFVPVITTTGNTNSTTTISGIAQITAIRVGMSISGSGITAGATVNAVNTTAGSITISAAATATASTVTLTLNESARTGSTNTALSHGFNLTASAPSIAYAITRTVALNLTNVLLVTGDMSQIQAGATIAATGIPSSPATLITAVDSIARTITLSAAATATSTATATITQGAAATFDATLSQYSALIPLTPTTNVTTSAEVTGAGAAALVSFGMLTDGLSFQLGGPQDSLWTVRPGGAIYGAAASTLLNPSQTEGSGYNAPNYWRDTDNNSAYPSDQTTGFWYYTENQWERNNHDFFAAFTPNFLVQFHSRSITANGRQLAITAANAATNAPVNRYSDLYTYDYSKVSLRYYTGSRAELESGTDTEEKWVWTQAVVTDSGGQPYIDIELKPAKKTEGVDYTQYSGYQTPIIRIFLKYCPDSWLNGVADNLLNVGWRRTTGSTRQATSSSALGWWTAGAAETGVSRRPIVDFRQGSGAADAAGLAAGTIQVIRAGAGMEQATFFALQFDQMNAGNIIFGAGGTQASGWSDGSIYRPISGASAAYNWSWEQMDKNPASPAFSSEYQQILSPARVSKGFTQYRQRLYFWANQSAPGQQGPPGVVAGTPSVVIPGSGFKAGDRATVRLRQRSDLSASPTWSQSYLYTFTAQQITAPSQTQSISSVVVSSGGTNYYGVPELTYSGGGGGFGLELGAVITSGAISQVSVLSSGDGFTQQPTISADSQTARIIPIMRPAMRGVYRCAYRYADWSMTEISRRTITTTSGSTAATLSIGGGASPDMVLESDNTQFMTRITSRSVRKVTLSRPAIATGTVPVVVRDMTKPIFYSNFSPITDIDTTLFTATPNPTQLGWDLGNAAPPTRATVVEFFRTSGDQSLVFYRLEQYGKVSGNSVSIVGTDTMTDEDLFNVGRPFYAAVPVVLPNGGLNAYRFGVPRSDMAVGAAYGDRLWYAVSTSGQKPNSIFYSEYDEFESCPPENELAIQNNQKSTDSMTGLIPFATYLLAMQNSHCYGLSYNTDPSVDASIQLLAHRGMLSQTCHDLFDDRLYAMDERGIYVMDRSGRVESLSDRIGNYFDNGLLDLAYRKRFFLKVDQRTSVLRAFVVTKDSRATTPNMAFCYHIDLKCWWTETWPNGLTCAVDYRRTFTDSDEPAYGAVDGDIYRSRGLTDVAYRSIRSATITSAGSGYLTPPSVTVASGEPGSGAAFTAILTDGRVTEILIDECGFGYGAGTIPSLTPTVALTISAPPSGSTATASASFDPLTNNDGTVVETAVSYAVRTGAMELTNDGNANTRDAMQDRSVSVIYRPTTTDMQLYLREFFNNSDWPRVNVMPRDRGTGFVHDTAGARTRLNMAAARSALGTATGVAKAQFAGRNYSDMGGADRHVAVELSGPRPTANAGDPQPSEVVLYGIEVAGVEGGG